MQRGRFQTLIAVLLVAALVVGGASLTGCSDDDSSSVPPELVAAWLLQLFSLDDGNTIQVGTPENYTIEFQSDGRAVIKADCNACSGRFFVDGDMLRFGTMACTLAACPPGSLDSAFVAALASTSRYEIVDGRLVLYYQGGSLTLARR
jgi:heat shock protein HslJ